MPKRSRSSSPSVPKSSACSTMPEKRASSPPAHTPKYHRSSNSPSPPPTTESASSSAAAFTAPSSSMQCTLPPHRWPVILSSPGDFDLHYAKEHTNRCFGCGVNLPSAWFLDLHLSERHDPLVAGQREQGEKTYKCFIETCEKITLTPQKRRLHLIDKHGYPRNYDFRIVDTGLDSRTSLLRSGGTHPGPGAGRRRRLSDLSEASHQSNGRGRGRGGSTRGRGIRGRGRGRGQRGALSSSSRSNGHQSFDEDMDEEMEKENSVQPTVEKTVPETSKDGVDDMDTLADRISALRFVPMSVRMREKGQNA